MVAVSPCVYLLSPHAYLSQGTALMQYNIKGVPPMSRCLPARVALLFRSPESCFFVCWWDVFSIISKVLLSMCWLSAFSSGFFIAIMINDLGDLEVVKTGVFNFVEIFTLSAFLNSAMEIFIFTPN